MQHSILINPPFIDPTVPPHFAAYLIGAARREGVNTVSFTDLNVELYNFLTAYDTADSIISDCNDYIDKLEKKDNLTQFEMLSYRCALKSIGLEAQHIVQARSILANKDLFYDYGWYKSAAQTIERYIDVVWCKTSPTEVGFGVLNLPAMDELSSLAVLTDNAFIDRFIQPARGFFETQIRNIVEAQPGVIGISCNYISQLPVALYLIRELNFALPNAVLAIGGTELTDIYKNIKNYHRLWELFGARTVLIIGEGESAFVKLIKTSPTIEGRIPPNLHPNIITRHQLSKKLSASIEDINMIGVPAYDAYNLDLYWSPEPVIMYSPTRGCYWNKCTFCDYGLNFDSPTSPSRQRSLAGVSADLSELTSYSRLIYFAVDAIAPSFLRKISQLIAERKFKFSWSAEIRLEGYLYNKNMGNELAEGGCIALSFGLESGSQRILDLIDKGVCISKVPELLDELNGSGIYVQLMGFNGFPTETILEAHKTYQFLECHKENWIISCIGTFSLTPGAMIVKNPKRFGVQNLTPLGTDITRSYVWTENNLPIDGDRNDYIRHEYRELLRKGGLTRPFVGGIDTGHSLLYFKYYREKDDLLIQLSKEAKTLVPKAIHTTPFKNVLSFPSIKEHFNYFDNECLSPNILEKGGQELLIKQSGNIYTTVKIDDITLIPDWLDSLLP